MDETVQEVVDLYEEAHGKKPETEGQAADWAACEQLITDEQRDAMYLMANI